MNSPSLSRAGLLGAVLVGAMVMLACRAAEADPALPEGVAAAPLGDRIERCEFRSAAPDKTMAFVIVFPRGYRAEGKP
jgi:hypothetical protein